MIWRILESKSAALVAAVSVDFPKSKCNFLHKTSLISYIRSNSSQGGALCGVFLLGQSSPLPCGSRRLCITVRMNEPRQRVAESSPDRRRREAAKPSSCPPPPVFWPTTPTDAGPCTCSYHNSFLTHLLHLVSCYRLQLSHHALSVGGTASTGPAV